MFALTVTINLIAAVVVYTSLWGAYKRERDTANRVAGNPKRAGRHRATTRPTMTWRG